MRIRGLGLDELECHLITDGDKGLQAAVRKCLPQAYHATCSYHRAQKLSEPRKTIPLLLKMAVAYTLEQYSSAREELEGVANSASFATVDLVSANYFCLAHMPSDMAEAEQHWHDCSLASCEFSALHYDGDPDVFDSDTVLEQVGHLPSSFGKTSSQCAESYASKMEKKRRYSSWQCFPDGRHVFQRNTPRLPHESEALWGSCGRRLCIEH